jgi:hypothetical protein
MTTFIDPRTQPRRSGSRPAVALAEDPTELEGLLALCKEGRLYEAERWVASGRPLQLKWSGTPRHRGKTPLEIAIKAGNHSLVLLLLSNGYDPDADPRVALDQALDVRRVDLAELLLDWGADAKRADAAMVLGTYSGRLIEHFYSLGIDYSFRNALAEALGYHTSNKPAFGFAKKHCVSDPAIRRQLDTALAQQAYRGSMKGAVLCLWAGADPYADVSILDHIGYGSDDEGEEEEQDVREQDDTAGAQGTAFVAACLKGHVEVLKRLGPDPERINYDRLYRSTETADIIDYLAEKRLPTNMTEVMRHLIWAGSWFISKSDTVEALARLFEAGGRWTSATKEEIGEVRRSLLGLNDHRFKSIIETFRTSDYVSRDILIELGRTPGFRKQLQRAGLMPEEGSRGWGGRHNAEEARRLLDAFGIPAFEKPIDLPRSMTIGTPAASGRREIMRREKVYEVVWSTTLPALLKQWHVEEKGLKSALRRYGIPVPPPAAWKSVRALRVASRPHLPRASLRAPNEVTVWLRR